jgi:hypothetical protein
MFGHKERRLFRLGVDVKGCKFGYVVLPPSVHQRTRQPYTWEASSHINDVDVADPPPWLVTLMKRSGSRANRGEQHQHTENVRPEGFYLGVLFKHAGMLGEQIKPGVFAVRCPNEQAHSPGKSSASSTVIFAPEKPGGRGTFFCAHTSACADFIR